MITGQGAAASAGARAVARVSAVDAAPPDWIPNPAYVEAANQARGTSLVTLRNNSNPPALGGPLREPRGYVQDCGKGTLAVQFADRVAFAAMTCNSWTCTSCRKVKGAKLLDRLHRGMASRPGLNRIFVTLTVNPAIFCAKPIGKAYWDALDNRTDNRAEAARSTTLWSEPDTDQFEWVVECMSTEWNKLNSRLTRKADRAGVARHGYFRVIELHRNRWPHYHVVIEHPTWKAADIQKQVDGWPLGSIVQARDISVEDAIGEVAPYLVSHEKKGNGTKAYQFAGYALPEGFRLHTSSQGFLADPQPPAEVCEVGLPLRGHFSKHHEAVKEFGVAPQLVLEPVQPDGEPHKPPSSSLAYGDAARLYLLAQVDAEPYLLTPDEEKYLY